MPAVVALPMVKKLRLEGLLATFVVPAPMGCNLNCSFCLIRARQEAPPGGDALGVEHYVGFLDTLAARHQVGIVSLQGYEPLLPESWAYSEALLSRAMSLGIPSALVTNGTYLRDHIADLDCLDVAGITVSLDASSAELHDRSRGTNGAFAKTVASIKAAASSSLRPRLMVASVLQTRRAHYLYGVPRLLASLGVGQWVVNPVLGVGREARGGHVQQYDEISAHLLALQKRAGEHGIEMVVDDELDLLIRDARSSKVVPIERPRLRRLPRLSRVVRLAPNGSCTMGEDVLQRVGGHTPHWRPDLEDVTAFVARAVG